MKTQSFFRTMWFWFWGTFWVVTGHKGSQRKAEQAGDKFNFFYQSSRRKVYRFNSKQFVWKILIFDHKFSVSLCKENVKSLEKTDYPFFQPKSSITQNAHPSLCKIEGWVLDQLSHAPLFTHAWNVFYLPSFSWLVIKLSGSAAALGIKKQLPHEQGGTLTSHFIQFFVTRFQNKWSFCCCLLRSCLLVEKDQQCGTVFKSHWST